MRIDTTTTDWPSPTPEEQVRARVGRRTRVLRRRRAVPLTGIPIMAAALVAALVLPDAGTRLSTEHGPADDSGAAESTTTTTPSSTTSTTSDPNRIVVSEDPAVYATPPDYVYARGVGKVPDRPEPSPTPATAHPLLTDPRGDSFYDTEEGKYDRYEAAIDITAFDVTADDTSVTVRIHVPDLGQPFQRSKHGAARAAVYKGSLRHENDTFALAGVRRFDENRIEFTASHCRPQAQTGSDAGAYTCTEATGARGSFDFAAGVVTITADFAALNAAAGGGDPVIQRGSTVAIRGDASSAYGLLGGGFDVVGGEYERSYRLGD